MIDKQPRIDSLHPVVLEDKRRVTLDMIVEDLPSTLHSLRSNIMFMPDLSDTRPISPPEPDHAEAASPYPDLELSILNGRRQQIASLFIVQHKERHLSLTMHLPTAELQEQYTARAEMTYAGEIIDVVEVPFTLASRDA